jgi:plastocyanin
LLYNKLRLPRLAQIALLAIASLAASGCSGSSASANGPNPTVGSDAGAAAGTGVTIVNSTYKPIKLRTTVGTEVKFVNDDFESHTVTADDGSFGSTILYRHHAFKHTFSKPGKYPYHCQIHPYMTGTVIVTK